MIFKDINRSFKRSRLFTTINIVGLSIGLAVSIMLVIFVLNELSFDKHFKNSDRIISLNTVMEDGGVKKQHPICTRRALTELSEKVPGIEAATQIYRGGEIEVVYNKQNFSGLHRHMTEASFFDVFESQFIEGGKEQLDNPNTAVITDSYATIIFGDASQAINKTISIDDNEFTIVGVVKKWAQNTHFNFDVLTNIGGIKEIPSIEFFTFYKIAEGMSVGDVSKSIEKEYTVIVNDFLKSFSGKAYGVTEKLTDIYLHSKADFTLGTRSNMTFVWTLTIISIMILLLAITNFVNLFIAQGESRLLEIGIRKANGAQRSDLIVRFLSEIATVVFIAFVIAFTLAIVILPYFSKLIERSLDMSLLYNPSVILCLVLLFVITVTLSASYPAFYLSKFNTLDILAKRIKFSKRKLSSSIVIFQALISITLLSYIFVVDRQTDYLKTMPINYNPKGVMIAYPNQKAHQEYDAMEQELLKQANVKMVSRAGHLFGGGWSGQGISLLGDERGKSINEYRVSAGICEMMELELIEGKFFERDNPKNAESIIVNEAAIRLLGLNYPAIGTTVEYQGQKEIIGVVKDFVYASPQDEIQPIALSAKWGNTSAIYIKFADQTTRLQATELVQNVFRSIDSEYTLAPIWLEDIYNNKFSTLETQSRILFYASILAVVISMLGLLAIHFYTTSRRTKEIAIRRVNGATGESLFITLSSDIFKWILIAGIIAAPIVYYIATNWLDNYANRIALSFWIFAIPVMLQLFIALITTSGVTAKVLSRNPVESLKSE